MSEEVKSIEDIRRGLYRDLIEIAKRLEIQVERDIETGHKNNAINTSRLAFKVIMFADQFREKP